MSNAARSLDIGEAGKGVYARGDARRDAIAVARPSDYFPGGLLAAVQRRRKIKGRTLGPGRPDANTLFRDARDRRRRKPPPIAERDQGRGGGGANEIIRP